MGEVVNIHVGGCGNRIGRDFWRLQCEEHKINPQTCERKKCGANEGNEASTEKIHSSDDIPHVFFNELSTGNFEPRAIFMDSDSASIDSIRSDNTIGKLFPVENFICSKQGPSETYALGHYGDVRFDMVLEYLDKLRKEVEKCDRMTGLQVTFSLLGGTGSGLGTMVAAKIREWHRYPLSTFCCVFPSQTTQSGILEPYNATFAIHQLIENIDMVLCFDNDSLENHSALQGGNYPLKSENQFGNLNKSIVETMSNYSCPARFLGSQLNHCDFRKMATNLTPFPRLHFISPSLVRSSSSSSSSSCGCVEDSEIVNSLFSKQNFLINGILPSQPSSEDCCVDGMIFSATSVFRGNFSSTLSLEKDLYETKVWKEHGSNQGSESGYGPKNYFIPWIQQNVKNLGICRNTTNRNASLFCNTTSFQQPLTSIQKKFTAMFRRNAFVHYYESMGMDRMEFSEAESNLNDLISEYQQYSDAPGSTGYLTEDEECDLY